MRFRRSLALLTLLLLCVAARGQVSIEHFRPVTTDTTLRLDLKITSAKPLKAGLNVRIVDCRDGKHIWAQDIQQVNISAGDTLHIDRTIEEIKARLWEPARPELYDVIVTVASASATRRVGFRSFEMRDGRFWLNGRPIFLRGNSINPPGRGIPGELENSREFARDYVRFLKGMNINIIRIHNNQDWLDVCDQEGMMVFGGRYGRPRGGTEAKPPADIEQSAEFYRQTELGPLAWHPSVVIFVLSNEQAYSGAAGNAYHSYLQTLYEQLKPWDSTRPYIGNAGYGLGRNGDIYDVHRYWGWYYNTFLTFLNLRDMERWQNPGSAQAITFTECVGNYTGVDGRYNLCSRTKQPYSQLCWTGHTPQDRQGDAALRYQAFVLKNATEMFRRLRSQNERLGGVMPFTIMFHNWDGITSFAGMQPKPAAYQYKVSYQPVLVSWETWTPNTYAGNTINAVIHLVNDDDLGCDLHGASIEWSIDDINRMSVAAASSSVPEVKYYDTWRMPVSITVPEELPTGYYTLRATVTRESRIVSQNTAEIFIAGREWNAPRKQSVRVNLYDTNGLTRRALDRLGVAYDQISDIKTADTRKALVIGELSWDAPLDASTDDLARFIEAGGSVVCMRQLRGHMPLEWIPAKVRMLEDSNNDMGYLTSEFMYCDGMNVNIERPSHPLFEGISRDEMRLWSDYTRFDESQKGFPAIYPVTQGFDLAGSDFGRISVYANYSRGLAATALCEIASGNGRVILSGFDLAPRSGIDPVADRLLSNLVAYAAGKERGSPYTYICRPIVWGDFASENGIVTLAHNGLILNTAPVVPLDQKEKLPTVVDRMGYWYAGEKAGGWNTKPGVQYMPYGRRPFAGFEYSRGGNVIARGDDSDATGFFLAEIPAGKSTMATKVLNPSDEEIALRISVNGKGDRHTLPARSSVWLTTPTGKDTLLKVEFRGDRRAVLLRTEFK